MRRSVLRPLGLVPLRSSSLPRLPAPLLRAALFLTAALCLYGTRHQRAAMMSRGVSRTVKRARDSFRRHS